MEVDSRANIHDIKYLIGADNEEEDDLFARTRVALENFWKSNTSATPSSPSISQRVEEKNSQRQLIYSQLEVRNVTNQELIKFLHHRDQIVQEKAIGEIAARLKDVKKVDLVLESFRKDSQAARSLVRLLTTDAVNIINQILFILSLLLQNEDLNEGFRVTGGIQELVKGLTRVQFIKSLPRDVVASVILRLSSIEKNRDIIRTSGCIVEIIVPLLSPEKDADNSVALAIKAISNLCTLEKNVEEICKSEIPTRLQQLMELSHMAPHHQEILTLLSILLQTVSLRSVVAPELLLLLSQFLDASKIHKEFAKFNFSNPVKIPSSSATEKNQLIVLDILDILSLHDSRNQQLMGPYYVKLLFSYLKHPRTWHFDVVEWNQVILEKALTVISNLLPNTENRQAFFEEDGAGTLIKILTLPQIFSNNVATVCATMVAQLSNTVELRSAMVTFGVKSLMKLLNLFPQNEKLQLAVVKTLKSLVEQDTTNISMTMFEEGAVQFIHEILKNSKNQELLVHVCETFVLLSQIKFLRKVFRILGMGPLISMCLNNSLQKYLIEVLMNVAAEDEGAAALMDDVNINNVILSGLESKLPEVTQRAARLTCKLLTKKDYITPLLRSGILPPLSNLLLSDSEDVQFQVLTLISGLLYNDIARTYCSTNELQTKIKTLAKHANVTKPNSVLVPPLRNLILALKNLSTMPQESTPPSSPGQEAWLKLLYKDQVKMIKFKRTITYAEVAKIIEQTFSLVDAAIRFKDSNGDAITISSQLEFQYFLENQQNNNTLELLVASSSDLVDVRKLDAILSQLSVEELKLLIIKLIPRCSINIKDAIRDVLTGERTKEQQKEQEEEQEDAPSPASVKLPPAPLVGASPQRKLMNEIETIVTSGNFSLRKVDTASEISKRKKDKELDRFQQMMDEMKERSTKRKIMLLDQGTIHPKEFWKQSLGRWYEEVEKAFVLDNAIMKLVFSMLEQREDEMAFAEAIKQVAPSTTVDSLATNLNNIGFTIKRNRIMEGENEKIEYCSIIRPASFPVKYTLRAILLTIGDPSVPRAQQVPSRSISPSLGNKYESVAQPSVQKSMVTEQPVVDDDLEDLLQDIK